jgi:hypothetical protein
VESGSPGGIARLLQRDVRSHLPGRGGLADIVEPDRAGALPGTPHPSPSSTPVPGPLERAAGPAASGPETGCRAARSSPALDLAAAESRCRRPRPGPGCVGRHPEACAGNASHGPAIGTDFSQRKQPNSTARTAPSTHSGGPVLCSGDIPGLRLSSGSRVRLPACPTPTAETRRTSPTRS